jgi:hypothetical protein
MKFENRTPLDGGPQAPHPVVAGGFRPKGCRRACRTPVSSTPYTSTTIGAARW